MFIQNRFISLLLLFSSIQLSHAAPGWNALASGLNGVVNTVVVHGSDVYVGGGFTDAGGIPEADYLARWDGTSWHAVAAGLSAQVRAIAISGNNIYVGGNFINAGGNNNADYIARWDGNVWQSLGNSPAVAGAVRSIIVDGSDVYIGGDFTNAGGIGTANFVARWNGSSWNALGPGLNNSVYSLALKGADLYAAGFFTDAGGNGAADRVARWNGNSWNALGTANLNGNVFALAVAGNNVYIGGSFTNAAGIPEADRVARWDGANWHALGTGISNTASTVYSLAYDGAHLFVGGIFFNAGGITGVNFIARWTGSTWEGLGGTLGGAVRGIGITPNNLYVGGDFINGANNDDINYIARYEYTALPVELSRFEAVAAPEGVWLHWRTESEWQNDYFLIEHSTDGIHFSALGRQAGAGNSTQPRQYTFLHRDPLAGPNYYRLRQTDLDGAEHLSGIRFVLLGGRVLQVLPNPVAHHFTINGLGETPVPVRLYDGYGKLLWEGVCQEGEAVDLTRSPPGLYHAAIRQDSGWKMMSVFKQ